MTENVFQPDWASPPGETISQVLDEKNISIANFGKAIGLSIRATKDLIKGNLSITTDIAKELQMSIGSTKSFWLKREVEYQEDKNRKSQFLEERKDWVSKFPYSDMSKFGWLKEARKFEEKERELFDYFDVKGLNEWYQKFGGLISEVSFRTSRSFDSQPESVICWLFQAELLSRKNTCSPWNKSLLREQLDSLRSLSRNYDPKVFIPEIEQILKKSGVTLSIIPTPQRCRASGATFFNDSGRPVIVLSFRYLSDDHFWFSLFHEIGHLLLHCKEKLFVELKNDENKDGEEREANEFSGKILIPKEFQEEFGNLSAARWRNIIRFAKKIGVSPGIVVGQLQHKKILNHNQLNKFKTRYKWLS
jgi:HTH-type transcriptional regulator/antitoxin HigA